MFHFKEKFLIIKQILFSQNYQFVNSFGQLQVRLIDENQLHAVNRNLSFAKLFLKNVISKIYLPIIRNIINKILIIIKY